MKSEPLNERRPTCLRCRQPSMGCWCEELAVQRTRSRFVLLQHPKEARNLVGTARMAHLSLEGSSLLIGVDFAANGEYRRLLAEEGERSVVIYPAPGARDVRELASRELPPTVWLIDGTWSQAQKMWRLNPALRELPAYRIEPRQPSQYTFRAEPELHCISTIEAVAELLEVLEPEAKGGYERFLAPFRSLVHRQVSHGEGDERRPRRRSHRRPQKPFVLPEPLDTHPERAVVFFVEGNGWPTSWEPRPPTEILQAMAVRPATGERLHLFVRPAAGLSPTALENLEIVEGDLAGWVERDEMVQRFRAFQRPDDVWCGWGHFTTAFLSNAGVVAPQVVDLRVLCKLTLRAGVGRVEDAHGLMALEPVRPIHPGRGGRRLAELEAVWGALLAKAAADRLAQAT